MRKFGLDSAYRFLRSPSREKKTMARDVWRQHQEDRRGRKWEALLRSDDKYVFSDVKERYLVRISDDDIGELIYIYGEIEFGKVDLCLKILGRDKVRSFVDIGMNVGQLIIPGLVRGVFESGIGIEPDPVNFGISAINADLNGVSQYIQLHHCAVSDGSQDRVLLALAEKQFGDHRIWNGSQELGHRRTISVPARRLDDFVCEPDPATDLVWIDVQGSEVAVLRGATAVTAKSVPICLELWPEGIQASGESVNSFREVTAAYGRFVNLDRPEDGPRDMAEIESLWQSLLGDGYDRDYVDVLLLA